MGGPVTTMEPTTRSRRVVALALALGMLPGAAQGCRSATAPPTPPGGGQALNLSFTRFEQEISPVLVAHGCDATGDCHGGGIRGSFQLSPPGAKNARFDFDQTALQVSASQPSASPILSEPLALDAGGTPHSVKVFASTSDPEYQAILGWIMAGVSP
jgi:hypothetical protein